MCLFSTESIPSTSSNIIAKDFAVVLLLFQWVTSFLFILTNVQAYSIIATIILVSAAVLLVYFFYKFNKKIAIRKRNQRDSLLDKTYIHPLAKDIQSN